MAKCVALLGTGSTQRYIFGSNRLQENSGASYLVAAAMEEWSSFSNKIFVGGGNAAVEFDDEEAAKAAIYERSEKWLRQAPGLRLTAAIAQYERSLANSFRNAQKLLFEHENAPPYGAEPGAFPVVRACPSTGGAANHWDDSTQEWLSEEAWYKRDAIQKAQKSLNNAFPRVPQWYYPLKFDDLGMARDASQIAIVHADGNGIGAELNKLTEGNPSDDTFRERLREFSARVTRISNTAFASTLIDLESALPSMKDMVPAVLVEKRDDMEIRYFPLRPIVFGGDDLTFVCHGRIGLALAVRYLQYFEACARAEGQPYTACAGVLVMPLKYPFARGYELAEELCANAKRSRGNKGSWIDFHILMEQTAGGIEQTRKEQYRQECLGRPYAVSGAPHDGKNWETFEIAWRDFSDTVRWPRNRAKRLLEAYAQGPDPAKRLLGSFESRKVVPVSQFPNVNFDALEALDFHAQPFKNKVEVPNAAHA